MNLSHLTELFVVRGVLMKDVVDGRLSLAGGDFPETIENAAVHAAPPPKRGNYQAWGKRAFDIAFALALLPVIAPVVAVLLLVVRRDGGSGLFGHLRVGRNGTEFRCWKIRTMVMDAEKKLQVYLRDNPEAAAEWARSRKLANDPRITPLGNFLRRTSLDELPQIWNVLKGEMSFVGPRPVVRDELKKYGSGAPCYLAQKPGVTGLWQVSGRNDVSYDERVRLDRRYRKEMTWALDARIILKTGTAVFERTGC